VTSAGDELAAASIGEDDVQFVTLGGDRPNQCVEIVKAG